MYRSAKTSKEISHEQTRLKVYLEPGLMPIGQSLGLTGGNSRSVRLTQGSGIVM